MIRTKTVTIKPMNSAGIANMNQRGFTLIEVLVTLALFAIITTSVAPSLGNFFTRNKVAATVNHVSSALQLARHTAINENRFVVMCPTTDMQTCTGDTDWSLTKMIFVDENGDGSLDANEEIIGTADLVKDFFIRSNRATLVFAPINTAGNTTATISICQKEDVQSFARALVIANVGRVRVLRDSTEIDCS